MSPNPVVNQELPKQRWQPSLIEVLIVLAIIAILLALLLPPTQWASSGSVEFPVRVFIFDAVSGKPLEGVSVGIQHHNGVYSQENTEEELIRWPADGHHLQVLTERTNENGIVVVEHKFRTGASHRRSDSQTHLANEWVFVAATGFGSLTIPVSNVSQETAKIREHGEIFCPIGLVPQ